MKQSRKSDDAIYEQAAITDIMEGSGRIALQIIFLATVNGIQVK